MSDAADMDDRHRLMLGEVAELSLSLARRLHEQAMAAESVEEAQGLALAFQRVSRSLRQTLALEARLERERRRGLVEDARREGEARRAAVAARKKHVGDVGSRLIWTEAERSDVGELLVELKSWCDEEAFHEEAFLDAPVEAVIARLKRDLGLAANDAAPGEAQSHPPERRSSA